MAIRRFQRNRRQIAEVKDSDNIAEIGLGLNPACMFK